MVTKPMVMRPYANDIQRPCGTKQLASTAWTRVVVCVSELIS
jgi:hypothetical protein